MIATQKIISLFLASFSVSILFSQSSNLNIKKYIENSPASPNAASLTKYVGAGVSLNSGMVNYSVPVYDLKFKNIEVPISLHYASNGIRVNEVPSLTGMGWTLQAGGVITRQRNGGCDEYGQRVSMPDTVSICSTQFHDFVFNYSTPTLFDNYDGEPDIFSFNFNGYSGKFVLDSLKKPFLLPKSNLKVSLDFNNADYTFIIVTPDGLKYYFGGDDATEETLLNAANRICTYGNSGNDIPVKTAFYLNKIKTPEGDSITFNYDIYCYEQMPVDIIEICNHVVETHECPDGTTACPDSRETYYNQAYYRYRVLRGITVPGLGRIVFTYSTYNTLTGADPYADYKTLSNIKVTNSQGRIINNTNFGYSNVETTLGAGDEYPTLIPSASTRPFLTSVTDGASISYSFQYYHPDSLPVFASLDQDFWGFYNGQNNTNFIPAGINPVECPEANADRGVYPQFTKYGMLKKIVSPTGGYDSIGYEGNTTTSGLVGGVRVNRIVTYDNLAKLSSVKKYYYAPLSKLDSVMGRGAIPVVQDEKLAGYNCGGIPSPYLATCDYLFTSSQPVNDLYVYGGNDVSYPIVTESLGENFENGAIEHQYQVQNYNYAYNVMNASIYDAPVNFDAVLNGTELKTKMYKKYSSDSFTLVQQEENFYSVDSSSVDDRIIGWKSYLKWIYINGVFCNYPEAEVSKTYYYRFWPHLDSTISTNYDQNGINSMVLKKYNYYENAQHLQVTKSQSYDSKGNLIETITKYPHDFVSTGNVYDSMVARNIIPAIETKTTKGSQSYRVKTNYSFDWFTDKHLASVVNIESQKNSNTTESRVRYYNYDSLGDFLELGKESDLHTSYIWDYNHSTITAEAKNAANSDIAFTSFEGDSKGNWTYNGVSIPDNTAPTGRRVYNVNSTFPISKSGLNSSTSYIITYWIKNATAYSITGTVAGYPILRRTIGDWKLYEHKISGQTSVSFSATGIIDELRLYPENAQMVTYVFEPMLGMTTQCDPNNRITYYEYDDFGRLLVVRDELKNILKKNCYNYYWQEFSTCDLYYNEEQIDTLTKNDCDSGYAGSQVIYTVPAGTYGGSSPSIANARAQSDILNYGQAYANANGTCTFICTTSNCTGVDKKCIDNICETGIKITTASTLIHADIYSCTYHYEWSDGSWSIDYFETHTGPCPISF